MPECRRDIPTREETEEAYGKFYELLVELLFNAVPARLHSDAFANMYLPPDEYDIEARMILQRMKNARSAEDVARIMHAVFLDAFDEGTAGSAQVYEGAGETFWDIWQK